ncbi:MAG: hypothetical protein AAGU11_22795 [Syntrophobacteraceae bacterium]
MDQQFGAARQAMSFQKSALDGLFGGYMMMWAQAEAFLNTLLDMSPWVPEQGKTLVRSWVDYNKKSCEYLKSFVETSYANLEMGASGMRMMQNTAKAAEAVTSPLKEVGGATPLKSLVDTTPLKPVTDMLLGQQESREDREHIE